MRYLVVAIISSVCRAYMVFDKTGPQSEQSARLCEKDRRQSVIRHKRLIPGEYDRALAVCQQVRVLDPNYWLAHEAMGLLLFLKGQHAEGIAEMETAIRLDPGSRQLSHLGHMYGKDGRTSAAQRVLQQLVERRKNRYVPSYCIADVYDGLGDFERANVWMNRAIDDHESEMVFLQFKADISYYRTNPHFPEWLKKIGFDR